MLTRVFVVILLMISVVVSTRGGEFSAGAAKSEITPTKWPVDLVGTFSRRLADRAWDPLYARALVLSDGHTQIAIVTVDSCYVPRPVFDEAKQRIQRECGIPSARMMMSATHTHSAPASRDRREVKADPDYVQQVTQGIVDAVVAAHRNLEPAQLGHAVVSLPEHLHNRRWFMKPGGIIANPFGETTDLVRMNPPRGSELLDRPAGPIDPDLTVLSLRASSGRPIALLANYSLHYVGNIPGGGVSADYFGEFAKLVESKLSPRGGDAPGMVALLSNGTSGDINNIDFVNPQPRKKPFEQMRFVARSVADAAVRAAEQADYRRDLTLAMAERRVAIGHRRPTPIQVKRAEAVLAAEDESSLRGAPSRTQSGSSISVSHLTNPKSCFRLPESARSA